MGSEISAEYPANCRLVWNRRPAIQNAATSLISEALDDRRSQRCAPLSLRAKCPRSESLSAETTGYRCGGRNSFKLLWRPKSVASTPTGFLARLLRAMPCHQNRGRQTLDVSNVLQRAR